MIVNQMIFFLTPSHVTIETQGEMEDEYLTSCLLMVFVAVSVPKLAKSESSMYQAHLEVIKESALIIIKENCFI